jgi:hypothetical protein
LRELRAMKVEIKRFHRGNRTGNDYAARRVLLVHYRTLAGDTLGRCEFNGRTVITLHRDGVLFYCWIDGRMWLIGDCVGTVRAEYVRLDNIKISFNIFK